jgi:hypothetical protein
MAKEIPGAGKAGEVVGEVIAKPLNKVLGFFGGKAKQAGSYLGATDKSGLPRLGAATYRLGTRVGLPLTAGLGVVNALRGGDPDVDYSAILKQMGEGTTGQPGDAEFEAYLEAIRGAGAAGGGGGGGGGAAADYGYLTGMSNQMGGASLAAMQRLADTYGQTATGTRAGGEAGAQALRDIYGKAAGEIQQGSRMAGTTGSSLVPVSGALAQLPADINRAGGSMADYLAQNELISAQDAGFLSNLSGELGRSYAQQIARQDQTFRMADAARRRAAAAAAAGRASEISREANITAAQLAFERAQSRPPALSGADRALAIVAAADEFRGFGDKNSQVRKALAAEGITTPEQYAIYRLSNPQQQG